MKKFGFFKHNIKLKSFQNKNKAVFDCMVKHGFILPEIRKSLMTLNGIKLDDLANGQTSIVTASNTIAGRRRNGVVMERLAIKLDLSVEQLFLENR